MSYPITPDFADHIHNPGGDEARLISIAATERMCVGRAWQRRCAEWCARHDSPIRDSPIRPVLSSKLLSKSSSG